jgi:hypothetical protein
VSEAAPVIAAIRDLDAVRLQDRRIGRGVRDQVDLVFQLVALGHDPDTAKIRLGIRSIAAAGEEIIIVRAGKPRPTISTISARGSPGCAVALARPLAHRLG